MAAIRGVVLDVDGTVATCPYDFDALRAAVTRVAARWGVDAAELPVRGIIERIALVAAGLDGKSSSRTRGGRAVRPTAPGVGQEFRREAERAVAELEVAAASTAELLPGAAEALAHLRQRGLKIGLITRNCRAAAERALAGLVAVAAQGGGGSRGAGRASPAYDVLLTRDDVPHPKPHPDHVLRAAAALHCRPEQVAVVGDHAFDMEAGRAAGAAFCLGVRTGNSPHASLSEAGAHAILDSIADLPEWLDRRREPGA